MQRVRMGMLFGCLVVAVLFMMGTVQAGPFDFGGDTVTFGVPGVNPEDFEIGPEAGHFEDVQELFNVNIEIYRDFPYFSAEEVISSIMIGAPAADVIKTPYHEMEKLAAEGFLFALDDVLDEAYWNSLPPTHRRGRELYAQFGPTTYAFSSNYPMYGLNGITWNKDLFEREGLPSLYDLQEEGEWTIEVLLDLANQLTRDTSGDGEIDQWGIQSIWTGINDWVVLWSLYSNEASLVTMDEGYVEFAMTDENATEMLEFWRMLIHDYDVVPPGDAGWGVDILIRGDLGMVFGDRFVMARAHEDEMADDYGFVFFPMGPAARDYVASCEPYDMFVLPVTSQRPEAKVELTNALFELTADYTDVEAWEQEEVIDEYYATIVRDRESLETVSWMMENWRPVRFYSEPLLHNTPLPGAIWDVLNDEKTATAAMDEVAPAVQALLDEVFMQ